MQRRRELVEQAQHRRGADRGDDPAAGFRELDLGLGPVAGADPVADPPHQVGLAGGGAAMQLGQLVRHLAAQAILQEIAEQVVQAQRRLGSFEDRDEQSAALDLLEPVRRPGSAATAAQRPEVSSLSTEQRRRKARSSGGIALSTSASR